MQDITRFYRQYYQSILRSNLPDNEIMQMENPVNFLQLPSSHGHFKTLAVTQTRFNGLTSKADQSLKTLTLPYLLIYLALTYTYFQETEVCNSAA